MERCLQQHTKTTRLSRKPASSSPPSAAGRRTKTQRRQQNSNAAASKQRKAALSTTDTTRRRVVVHAATDSPYVASAENDAVAADAEAADSAAETGTKPCCASHNHESTTPTDGNSDAPPATTASVAVSTKKVALESDSSLLVGDGYNFNGVFAALGAVVVAGGAWFFVDQQKEGGADDSLKAEELAEQEQEHQSARLRIRQAAAVQSAINYARMANHSRAHVEIERAIDVHTECRRSVLTDAFQSEDVERVYKLAAKRLSTTTQYPRMILFRKLLNISDADGERLEAQAADEQKGSFVI